MGNEQLFDYMPDYVVTPGETLLDTIESLGISQAELARRTDRPAKTINGIIKGNTSITSDTALQLEKVLGIPAIFWLNLESNYQQDLARKEDNEQLSNHTNELKNFPVNEICKRGYMEEHSDKSQQLSKLLQFFGVASMDALQKIWYPSVSFRKTDAFQVDDGAMMSWIRMVEIEASKIECEPYDKTVFEESLEKIRTLTKEPDPSIFVPKLIDICSEAGVAVVFSPEIKGSRVSGITKWITPKKAIIGLSLRHKSNDQLWFTFFHEAAHILLHEKRSVFLEGLTNKESVIEKEHEANEFSANLLIPAEKYSDFVSSYIVNSKKNVIAFANSIGIAPGIVVGRLQKEKKIPYSHLNGLKHFYKWKDR